ncbi:hypothetical protein Rleg5DRAFT_1191 [Rhizobium leguminosarum bv. viciae WSM1455]|nr:hypothetical protein Rleg5DRAFT_1191 [Rhizobium leguminosarum bv. viciae WSM1455]
MMMAAGSATNAWHHERRRQNTSINSGHVRRRASEIAGRLVDGYFGNRSWGVTVKRSEDGKRTWLYGEELGEGDIVSFNLYRLAGPVIEFVLGFEPSMEKAAPRPIRAENKHDFHAALQHVHGCTAI